MTYPQRTYPHGHHEFAALDQDWFARVLDASQKVAVYFPLSADTVTVVSYHDTVSAANTAATAAVNSRGAFPRVRINWTHSDIVKRPVGPVQHRKAEVALPAWIDADPLH